jgi:hypothetical protein
MATKQYFEKCGRFSEIEKEHGWKVAIQTYCKETVDNFNSTLEDRKAEFGYTYHDTHVAFVLWSHFVSETLQQAETFEQFRTRIVKRLKEAVPVRKLKSFEFLKAINFYYNFDMLDLDSEIGGDEYFELIFESLKKDISKDELKEFDAHYGYDLCSGGKKWDTSTYR